MYLPFLFNFVILKVAFPFLFVIALNNLPLIFKVTQAFLIGLLLFFKTIVYFLILVFLLNTLLFTAKTLGETF